jgi:BASS family bile acid:Na+ symporter
MNLMYALPIINAGVMLVITALGLRTRPADTLLLFRSPALGVRAVLAMFVFVPACTLLMVWRLPLEPAIQASLLALAVAPVAPIVFRARTSANTDGDYTVGLQVFTAVVSLAAVPAMLAVAERVFDFHTRFPVSEIAIMLLRAIGLPLAVGIGLARLLGDKRVRVALWLERIGSTVLTAGMVLILALLLPKVWFMAVNGRLLSVVAVTGFMLLGCHLFGGPEKGTRIALTMGSAQRHPGISFVVATTVLPAEEETIIAVIVMFLLVSTLAIIPYMLKRDDPVADSTT